MKYIVYDTLCSEVLKSYKLRHSALKRAKKEIVDRGLLPSSIVVFLEEFGEYRGRCYAGLTDKEGYWPE